MTVTAKKDIKLLVNISLEPEDASLFIDNIEMPTLETFLLSPGLHQVKVIKEGFETLEQAVVIDDENQNLTFKLEPISESGVNIESQPVDATVYLDGIKLGQTPLSVFFPTGFYQLEIRKNGYFKVIVDSFEVKYPSSYGYYILEENMGLLTVNTDAESAVFINSEFVENPHKVPMSPQLVEVMVTKPKADTLREQFILKRHDDIVIDMFPEIATGFLQISVVPFNTKVDITGEYGEHFTSNGIFPLKEIEVGKYQITATAEGYHQEIDTIVVSKNEKVNHQIKLKLQGADPFTTFAGIEMVYVKGGTFKMGCSSDIGICGEDELPVHEVTVNDFFISKHEITQDQWYKLIKESPSKNRNCDNCPVEKVTWGDIQLFLEKLREETGHNFRLPTEAEWEYAARGGNKSRNHIYSGSNDVTKVAWHSGNAGNKTHEVGLKDPNELGLHDMSGNVWEWCADWYSNTIYSEGNNNDPRGPENGTDKVLRGGSYFSNSRYSSVSNRDKCLPDKTYKDYGFRIALTR